MDDGERDELVALVREALFRTYRMRLPDGTLPSVLPLIETQLAWCLQQLRMEEHPGLPPGKEMNMDLAALREFSSSFGGGEQGDEYYQLIIEIQYRFERAVDSGS